MATFVITAPDGTEYEITAPDGATEEEVMAYAKTQFSASLPTPDMRGARQERTAPPPQPTDPHDYMTREEVMPNSPPYFTGTKVLPPYLEDAAIGFNRFFHEAGQGIKEKYKMAFGDEGESEAYTEQINADRDRYNKITEGAGFEDVGYYGGMASPASGTGKLGILRTAALGALETGILPTETGEPMEAVEQALKGAVFAGVFRSMPDAAAAFKSWRNRRRSGKLSDDVAAFAKQYGIKIPRSVHSPTQIGRASEEVGTLPLFGRWGSKAMREDTKTVLKRMDQETSGGGTVQDAYVKGRETLKKADKTLWNNTYQVIGDAPVNRQSLNEGMEEILTKLSKRDNIGKAEAAKIRQIWKPMKEPPKFKGSTMEEYAAWKEMGENMREGSRGFDGDTLADLHRFRARMAAHEVWGQEGWKGAAKDDVYALLTAELKTSAKGKYGKKGLEMFNESVDSTKKMHRAFENTGVATRTQQDLKDSELSFVRAALGNDPDKMTAMRTIIGEKGLPTVQNQIVQSIIEKHAIGGTKAAATHIRGLDKALKTFFDPDQAAAIRGFSKFMDNIPKEQMGWMRNLVSGGFLTGAGMVGGVPAAAVAGTALFKFLRRKDVTTILQKLNTAPKDSALYKSLTNQLSEGLMVAAGVEASRELPTPDMRGGLQ